MRALPASLPHDHLEVASRGPLYFQSIRASPLRPRYKLYVAESTAYSQEAALNPRSHKNTPGMSRHAETPAGTVPKYRLDGGYLHQIHTVELLIR